MKALNFLRQIVGRIARNVQNPYAAAVQDADREFHHIARSVQHKRDPFPLSRK